MNNNKECIIKDFLSEGFNLGNNWKYADTVAYPTKTPLKSFYKYSLKRFQGIVI